MSIITNYRTIITDFNEYKEKKNLLFEIKEKYIKSSSQYENRKIMNLEELITYKNSMAINKNIYVNIPLLEKQKTDKIIHLTYEEQRKIRLMQLIMNRKNKYICQPLFKKIILLLIEEMKKTPHYYFGEYINNTYHNNNENYLTEIYITSHINDDKWMHGYKKGYENKNYYGVPYVHEENKQNKILFKVNITKKDGNEIVYYHNINEMINIQCDYRNWVLLLEVNQSKNVTDNGIFGPLDTRIIDYKYRYSRNDVKNITITKILENDIKDTYHYWKIKNDEYLKQYLEERQKIILDDEIKKYKTAKKKFYGYN